MLKKVLFCAVYFMFLTSLNVANADENAEEISSAPDYQYFQLDPDIITNYVKSGKKIGYVRVTIELMARTMDDYEKIKIHNPLIRDRIITILGEQNEMDIKSIAKREEIRLRCLNEVNEVLLSVTGNTPIQDLLFTKYLYQ